MGYTHYYRGLAATPALVADARKIIGESGMAICGPRDEGLPILSQTDGIRLNSFAPAGEAYATFSLPGAAIEALPGSAQPKRKPYDVVVTAILTAAAVHNPGTLRSDGHWHNRTPGVTLYEIAV